MSISIDSIIAKTDANYAALEKEVEQNDDFKRILSELDDFIESNKKTEKQKADEAKAAQEARDRQRKIAELSAKIAQLRQRLYSSGFDKVVAAQISEAQTELFWLMFSA